MQTRSSSRLVSNPFSNPTPSTNPNPKGRNRRRSKQRIEDFNIEEISPPIVTMADQRTMAQLLQAPTEGYEDAIVVRAITAFELKHSLITLVHNKQFFGHDKQDPHAHVRYFNKITSTLKFQNVPNTSIKLMLFPFSLEGAAQIWLEKEPPRSIFTWDDLVLKFINQFFPPSKTTNLRNEITNFQQRFDGSFMYDVLRLTPFFKAFLVTVDVSEIYMQKFWAIATVHHHSIRFKMDNTKHIVILESFSEMLHICLRLHGQTFIEPPFEEVILAFLRFLRHSGAIRRLTDVEHKDTKKSNEMYYPRFTKVIIYHFMSKDPSIPRRNKVNWHYVRDDHMFTMIKLVSRHQNTQQFGAMLPIEITNADIRKSDAYKEYYAVAKGATPPKPKASVRKTRSSSDTTVTPLTTAAGPRLSTSAKGKQPTTTSKAKSLSALLEEEISWNFTDEEGDDDEGDDGEEGNDDDAQDDDDQEDEGNDKDDQEEGSDASDEEEFIHPGLSTHAKEETRDDERMNVGREEGQDKEDEEDELYKDININLGRGIQMGDVHTTQEFEDSHVTLTPVNPYGQQQSSSVSSQFVTSMINLTPDAGIESIFETTSQMGVQTPTSVAPLYVPAPTLTSLTIATITTTQQAPTPLTTASSTLLQDLPNFGSLFGFDHRLKTLEANFSEFMQMNQFAGAVSSILDIVQRYMDQRMNEAVKVSSQIQSDRLRDEAQVENDEFLKTIDENMQKIIKEQVKEQVKVQVSKILPTIEQTVNEQLEAKVLTRSSNSLKPSYAVAADLSEMELKKILIEEIEGNKSIHRSNEQRNLCKALVEAYESDKIILYTYGDTVTLKRRRDDDADKDEEPSTRSDRGSKRRREEKEPESANAPKEKATRSAGKSTQGFKYRQTLASESATSEEPMQTTFEMEEPSHPEFETGAEDQPIVEPSQHAEWFSQQKKPPTLDCDWNKTLPDTHGSIQPWISKLAKQSDSRSSFNELMDTPMDLSAFLMNRLKVDTLTPKLLAGPTYELMKGSCKSLVELEFFLEEVYKATTDQLDWVNPEGQQYPHNLLKPLPLIPNFRGHRVIPFDHFINNDLEYLCRGASSHKYTTSVTKTKAADCGYIKWIEDLVPRTMWIQEPVATTSMPSGESPIGGVNVNSSTVFLSTGSLLAMSILSIESSLSLNSRFIVIQRRVEDLQLGVESYQKKLNLTKPDTYRSDLKGKEAYITYSNPRGFIYQNKDKQNMLMRIDELHKFNDGTLTDVRTALDDRLKGIRIKYLPQSIWRKSDKDRVAAMIQTIDKILKTRRIIRSLERFVGGRLYEGDFRMLQRTI
nr:reverse transcriptase domain-containing protein [Tanacetum cinerariifolium]